MSPTTVPYCAPSRPTRAAPSRRSLAAALLLALAPFSANAATIAVTSPDDSDSSAIGTCTLRQAIMSMDVGGLVAACHKTGAFGVDDTITFATSAITGAATPGTVTLADSADAGGGIGGTLLVTAAHLTIDGSAWRGSGPGLYPDGVTIARPVGATNRFGVLRDSAPAGSRLVLVGVAIRNGDAFEPRCNGGREGGGVCMEAADLSMSDCRVSGNTAAFAGGGIASPSGAVTLERCTIDHNTSYLGGGVGTGTGTVTITSSTIEGNGEWGTSHGGGVHALGALVVVDSTISGNLGKLGAGIAVDGTLSLTRSLVAGNEAYYDGGGIHAPAGTITLAGSTVSNNFARYNGGGIHSAATLTVTNSTISGNHSLRDGAGIYSDGIVHLVHATISANSASGVGGGLEGNGSATIDRSIVAGNTQSSGGDIDMAEPWTGSNNLVFASSLDLGPLQDNGGSTPTMMPGPTSAAIDAIAPVDCVQTTDQRGIVRPQGTGCDIGAVEVASDAIFADGFE
ncbi:choice-of-anchor Q domain-containing protein [Dokdonella sp.]|uniref:choice-of-anchor Q domain-containing protein n=1 Tax=Dokdonella sp. TaxID=2291710 RepID=UPI0037837D99